MSSAFEGLPKTPNYNLNKPSYDNVADIEALNENADIIDAQLKSLSDGKSDKSHTHDYLPDETVPISKGGTGADNSADARTNLGLGSVATLNAVPIANGGTGATTASQARVNLGLNTVVTNASIKGKVITLTFADGTTKTLTTQDTGDGCPYITKVYKNGLSWYVKYSNGWVEQGSSVSIPTANVFKMTNLLVPMKDGTYSAVATGRNASTGKPYYVTVGNSEVNSGTQLGLLSSGGDTGAQYRVAGWAAE